MPVSFSPCVQTHFSCLLNISCAIGMSFLQISHLKLAWNSTVHMRLGCFGSTMVVKKVLRLEKDTQTKENQVERLGRADLFVRMRVTD